MFKNSLAYVTRKKLKSLLIFVIVLMASSLTLISLAINAATDQAAEETLKDINNSFSMQINRQYNPGTPRGGGNVAGKDIQQIADLEDIVDYVKRINSVADLPDLDLVDNDQIQQNQSSDRQAEFGHAVMITGVNQSAREDKFVSGEFELVEGKPLEEGDKNQILMHKDLAAKNHLKVGDKVTIKSNRYDADNVKQADETLEVTIKGLFDGHNKSGVTVAQELYENNVISDIDTAAKVYGNDEETAAYQDATFFVKGGQKLDNLLGKLQKLDIDWRNYQLIKSSSNYPMLQASISGIYGISKKILLAVLIFAAIVLSLLLILWMNARRAEIGIFLALGISKLKIFGQFAMELLLVSIPAFIASLGVAKALGQMMGSQILNQVTGSLKQEIASQSSAAGLGGGAEVDGFNKTITSLSIHLDPAIISKGFLFILGVLALALALASLKLFKKSAKDLLIDIE